MSWAAPAGTQCVCVAVCCLQVREARGRLLSYWRRQVLVEAAAEAFPPTSSVRGPPHIRAMLDNQVGTGLDGPRSLAHISPCWQQHVNKQSRCLICWSLSFLPCSCVYAQVEVEVLVPLSWPSEPSDSLSVVELTAPGLSAGAAQQLLQQVNGDAQLLARCDVLVLLQHLSAAVEAQLAEAAAS